jgi:L-asparaginase
MTLGKVCLIYTGGTIGMRLMEDKTLKPPDDPTDFLRVAPELKDEYEFDFVPLMSKDSTNINPHDWKDIATAIYERRNLGYAGFVIAHGTDTMHFSASAVAFALGTNLNFPVVFTGSQTIPEVHHGDARINLLRAFKVATDRQTRFAEVVISFGDYVFRGCRAQKKDERRFDAFESPAYPPLAYITEELIPHASAELVDPSGKEDIDFQPDFAGGVVQMSLIPGLEPEILLSVLKSQSCKGIILQSFGAGNVPNAPPYSFLDIVGEVRKKGIPLIITSQFPANATLHTAYEPGKQAIDAGAIPTGNMTASCAVAKFRWVIAKVEKDNLNPLEKIKKVHELMQRVFIKEMDVPTKPNGH